MSERNDLPSITASNFDQRVRETLQTYLGRQGDPLDRGLTLRDLIENGIVKLPDGWRLRPGAGSIPLLPGTSTPDGELDLTPPPTPTGFAATAGISYVIAQHANPTYTVGGGHLRTRLYGATRATGAPAPVFADAVEIAQFTGVIYAHPTNPATTWHLWIKWESVAGVLSVSPAGGTNGVVVTTGQDVSLLLTALTGQITQSQLFVDLGARINLIDANSSVPNSVNARLLVEANQRVAAIQNEADARATAILNEAAARASGDQALQTQINTLSAASSGDFQDLIAAIQQEQTARIAGDAAEATSRETLATQLRGSYSGTNPALLTTGLIFNERQARVTAEGVIASSVSALSATVTNNYNTLNSAITTEQSARISGDNAITTNLTALTARVGSAESNITTLQTTTAAQATQITTLSTTIGAKNKTFAQTTAPTSTASYTLVTNDLWYDTDDSFKLYRWTGTDWADISDSRITTQGSAITALQTTTASQATSLSSLTTRVGTAETNITSLQTTTANQATSISQLTSSVNGNTTSIQTLTSTTNGLSGQYTVKIDNNGYVTGYGLASTAINGTPSSSFIVRADSFSIGSPSGPGTVSPALPFIVRTTATTINGVSVPIGVYLTDGFIQNGTITNAKIGNAAIDDAKIANLSAAKITAGTIAADRLDANIVTSKVLSVDWAKITNASISSAQIQDAAITSAKIASTIQSDNFASGSAGWQINRAGTAEFNNLTLRGKLVAGSPLANQVELGANVSAAGHHGLSLSGNNFNNCFIRREADGIVFFRLNGFGPNSLNFDSASGQLTVRGDIEASSLRANTVMVQTLNIAGTAVTVPIYGASFVDTRTYGFGWYTVLTLSVPVFGLQSGEFVGLIVNSVSSLYPAEGVATDVTLGIFVNGVLVTELAASLGGFGFSHAGAGYALVGNGSNTVEFKYRSSVNKSMTILTYATALAGKR